MTKHGQQNHHDDTVSHVYQEPPEDDIKEKHDRKKRIKYFFGIGQLEPRTLDFQELAKGHAKSWGELTAKDQAEQIRIALLPQEFLLDPQCPYLKYWDVVILSALCYTALVTPYEVAFLETGLNPLFFFNRFIDCIFCKDMVMQFFLKVQLRERRGTVWIRNRAQIRKRYFKGWFTIDFLSIFPFDTMGLVLQSPDIQKLKVIRIVRLMRLLKLVRMLRASRIMKRWENRTSMSYASQGLCKFTLLLTVSAHWMGCLWGLVGRLLSNDLVCDYETGEYTIGGDLENRSWITLMDWGPNSPCLHIDCYLASLHFAVMTITSIGYGDITPTRNEEFFLCILCQLVGGLTWACVIGSICGIISNQNPVRVAFEQSMDALNAMLGEQGVPTEMCWRLREYLREQQYHYLLLRSRDISQNFSMELQGALIPETAIGAAISAVWYFRGPHITQSFIVDVTQVLVAAQHSPQEKVGGAGILTLVQRGSVGRQGRILCAGDFWGEDMILTSQYLANGTPGIALGFVELLTLTKHSLDGVLVNFPEIKMQIRRAGLRIAFRNAMRIVAKERLRIKAGEDPSAAGTPGARLIAVFDSISEQQEISVKGFKRVRKNRPSAMDLIHGSAVLEDDDDAPVDKASTEQFQHGPGYHNEFAQDGKVGKRLDKFEKELSGVRTELQNLCNIIGSVFGKDGMSPGLSPKKSTEENANLIFEEENDVVDKEGNFTPLHSMSLPGVPS